MIKNFLLPNPDNNYTPHAIKIKSLVIILIMVLLVNIVLTKYTIVEVSAAIDFTTLYQLHNEEREKYDLPALSINTSLIDSASTKAGEMMDYNCWSHYCPEGTTPWKYFDEAGYRYVYAGENLAEGFNSNDGTIRAWINSPSHRDNILNPKFDEIGIVILSGDYQGISDNMLIVVHFGTRKSSSYSLTQKEEPTSSDNSTIRISSPEDNSVLSDQHPEVVGTGPRDSNIEIYFNDDLDGSVIARGQNFTYRPPQEKPEGYYKIDVKSFDADSKLLAESEPINITIDTTPPNIIKESIKVISLTYSATEKALMQVLTEGSPDSLISNLSNSNFTRLDDNKWEIELPIDTLNNQASFLISAVDAAGNMSRLEVPSSQVLDQIESISQEYPKAEIESRYNVLSSFVSFIAAKDIQTKLNLIFILFLASIFAIDFYVLSRAGLTGIKKSKSHLHLTGFVILLIIGVIGGLSGSTLTGLSNT